ncbi:MAG: hypothetical protein BroJett038_33200 [Chloroflexota bacterium]|nr:MAG: hypothetical protein BroJett038_33200 [Chloroflexota bacterium]
MFANMEGVDWLIGKGAGATFTIVSWDQVLVLQSAHVVAFTFLFKAGVIVFLAVCVVPPTMAIIRVFRFVARGGKSLSDFPNFAADASLITLTCLLFTSFGWGSSLGFAFVLIFGLRKIGLHEEEVKKRYSRVSYIN